MDSEHHEEIARGLFRESNDALFSFDTDENRVLDLNPVAQRLTGFSKEQARALGVWDLFSGDVPGALDRLVEAYHRTGFYHSREGFYLSRRDGSMIPVNVSVSRMHTRPKPIGLVVARDVSERKRSEEALRASEARYRRLIDTAPVVFWTVDAHARITSLNPEFAVVTGLEVRDWIGRPMEELFLIEDRWMARDLFRAEESTESPPPVELRIPTRGSEPLVLEFVKACDQDADARHHVSGIARNVTAARRAEKLERAKVAAEMADQAKSSFLAHFSHEIRTPLTSILGFTEVLLSDAEVARLPKDRLDDLRIIRQSGSHLLSIINDILDLSQIEAGKVSIELKPCSPASIVREVISALKGRAEEKGLTISSILTGPVPDSIQTDPVRFRQILMNLVGNAIKFTQRGHVKIEVRTESSGAEASSLAVEVSDTGIGMSPAQTARLFEPFYQASQTNSGGTGLGLAISRRLAERLGGHLMAESEEGRGSSFLLKLPLGQESVVATHEEPARPAPPAPTAEPQRLPLPGRVLLAEDNAAIQRVIAFHLEKAGARVQVAKNGQEAIDLACAALEAGDPFDVVLMDMQMPVLDGYEATRQLRALDFPGRIIAITAYAMAEDREECLRLGCDDHLSKPIDWILLNHRIAAYLAEKTS